VQSVINRSPNMWTLIGLGNSVAFIYSVVATVAPQISPATFVVDGRVTKPGLVPGFVLLAARFGKFLPASRYARHAPERTLLYALMHAQHRFRKIRPPLPRFD